MQKRGGSRLFSVSWDAGASSQKDQLSIVICYVELIEIIGPVILSAII